MTPGILALISLGVLVVGFIVIIYNFVTALRSTVGDLKPRMFVVHMIAAVVAAAGMGGLIFSALWFLVLQVGKGS